MLGRQRGRLDDSSIREKDVNVALLVRNLFVDSIEIAQVELVAHHLYGVSCDLFYGFISSGRPRPVTNTNAPSAANRFAAASPIPQPPPVIKPAFPSSADMLQSLFVVTHRVRNRCVVLVFFRLG